MNLHKLLDNVEVLKIIGDDVLVNNLSLNSVQCVENSMFFAINGNNLDGNNYINEAISKGASVIVTENAGNYKATQVIVKNVNKAMSVIAYNFYNLKNIKLKIIGIVGTNGKTTTSYILRSILSKSGKNVSIIGTLGAFYNSKAINYNLTTPDSISLSEIINDMNSENVDYLIMELSAHAISQYRAYSLKFESLIFTNCTQDHLDYFTTLENYFSVKKSVFTSKNCNFAVINSDDKIGVEILNSKKVKCYSYALNSPSDVFAINILNSKKGLSFMMNVFDELLQVDFPLIGKFNVYNVLSAVTTAYVLGVSLNDISLGLCNVYGLSGRMEYVESFNGGDVYVDYAHTPDGLLNTLKSLREITKGRLIVLFGCGGNRDKSKRKLMGEIAGENADFTIITSDNPRFEEPYKIISEIEKGVREKSLKYITIQNRYIATGYAIEMLKKGDTLVLAGKGSENYQEVMGVKRQYSDIETVKDIISKIGFVGEFI